MAINSSTQHGKRLIPQILDNLASTEPDRIIYSVVSFSGPSHEFRHISARTFAMAVDKTAWWLRNQVGQPTSVQAVGYIGPRKWKETAIKPCNMIVDCTDDTKMIFDTFC